MTGSAANRGNQLIFYGWWIVAAAFILLGYIGGVFFFGFSIFFQAMVTEFGWSRAATALAFSLATLERGIADPIIGLLVDRHGTRLLMLVGVALAVISFAVFSQVNSLATFYAVYLIMALGAAGAGGLAPQAAVANWFVRKRGIAFGLLTSGFSVGGAVMLPLLGWMVGSYGWRAAAAAAALLLCVLGVPLSLVVRHRPEPYGYLPDGDPWREDSPPMSHHSTADASPATSRTQPSASPRANFTVWQALRTRTWWLLALVFTLRNLALSAVVAHQVPLLVDRGFDPQTAANLFSILAVMGVPGRLAFGFLGDFFTKRYLLTVALLLQVVGLMVLVTAASPTQVYIFDILFGLSWGAVPVFFAIRADYFGEKAFAAIGGFFSAAMTTGSATGPVFAGWVFDITASYEMAILIFALATAVAAVAALFATPPQPPR